MKKPTPRALLARLFGSSNRGIRIEKNILTGYATAAGTDVCVIGTAGGTYIDNAAALKLGSFSRKLRGVLGGDGRQARIPDRGRAAHSR